MAQCPVVGASASGVQIADELQRAGRDVVLAVGSHTRVPRRYRGVDIHRWLELIGELDRGLDGPDDPRVREPSLQLAGRAAEDALDLSRLQANGVRLAGCLEQMTRDRLGFGPRLDATLRAADERLRRPLARIDSYIAHHDLRWLPEPAAIDPVMAAPAPSSLDLGARGIRTVVWATGFTRAFPWLHLLCALTADKESNLVDWLREIQGGTTVGPAATVVNERGQHSGPRVKCTRPPTRRIRSYRRRTTRRRADVDA